MNEDFITLGKINKCFKKLVQVSGYTARKILLFNYDKLMLTENFSMDNEIYLFNAINMRMLNDSQFKLILNNIYLNIKELNNGLSSMSNMIYTHFQVTFH